MAIEQISSTATATSHAPVARPRPASVAAGESASETASPPADSRKPSADQVRQALSEVQKAVEPVARSLRFSIDGETGKTVITVVDSATKEVIRQIPGEEILAIAKAIDRMQGLLLKQKA